MLFSTWTCRNLKHRQWKKINFEQIRLSFAWFENVKTFNLTPGGRKASKRRESLNYVLVWHHHFQLNISPPINKFLHISRWHQSSKRGCLLKYSIQDMNVHFNGQISDYHCLNRGDSITLILITNSKNKKNNKQIKTTQNWYLFKSSKSYIDGTKCIMYIYSRKQ